MITNKIKELKENITKFENEIKTANQTINEYPENSIVMQQTSFFQ